MPAVKKYTRINYQNYPSTSTPLNATNLNKMDKGIDDLDDELVTVKNAIENMSFDADAISYDNTQSRLQATDVQGAVDEINDNLAQTPITVGGETLSTIDEKLNYLCNGGGNGKITFLTNHQLNLYAMLLENNQMPTIEISMVIQHTSSYTDTGHGTYIDVTCTGQGSGASGWTKIDIYAKLSGKYAIKGFSTNEDRVVTVNANELIISVSDMAGHNLPALVSDESVATIQYLGNN